MYISVCFSYYIFMWRRSTDDSHKKTLWNLTFFIFAVVMSAQFILFIAILITVTL